ncbi:MAG TPA: CDP-diacylglycerol--serine O-phosphatidyltransferase [Elusimicrobiota bacterium]|jgi:CDP-diacylglycerol--serine O-phosphatidyltransferase|nr:CDP-diacylglycerol--serine O-phosphatidyltransferase [Elusimicrobiota bacterium]
MESGTLKRSGQLLAPSLFTMGNMACGFYALLNAHVGEYSTAAKCILGGIVFDMLDGRIARLVHGESSFGVEFDSLADFLTFGVAPAYMMYALFLKDYGIWGYVAAFIYTLCGGLRLARFNAYAHAGKGSKTHFTGLPIPGGAGVLASFVLLYSLIEQRDPSSPEGFWGHWIPVLATAGPFLVVALGALMASTIPYGAFKQVDLLQPQNRKLLAVVMLILALVYVYPENSLFLMFFLYALSGFVRRRAAPAAEKHP